MTYTSSHQLGKRVVYIYRVVQKNGTKFMAP